MANMVSVRYHCIVVGGGLLKVRCFRYPMDIGRSLIRTYLGKVGRASGGSQWENSYLQYLRYGMLGEATLNPALATPLPCCGLCRQHTYRLQLKDVENRDL